MIISIAFSNFYSFAERTEVSFEVGRQPASSTYDIKLAADKRLNKAIAVIGANGSGKTQLIKPLAFLSWFICDSFLGNDPSELIPFKPHALYHDRNTEFELHFLLNDGEYRYRLKTTREHVISESLQKKTSHLFSTMFSRERSDDGTYAYTQNTNLGFKFKPSQATEIRGNASLISAGHNFDVELASSLVNYFDYWTHNLHVSGRSNFDNRDIFEGAGFFHKNKNLFENMQEIIADIDLGIDSVKLKEHEITDTENKQSKVYFPIGVHIDSKHERKFQLPFFEESSGTQSAFVLLRRVLPVLAQGGLAIIDEIDNDLHPHMLPYILELFKFDHTNPHNAQIIFTCHTPEILNLLKKHQIYLTEKESQQSEAWRLDSVVGLRADDNLYSKYMAGALSAVPNL